jgi:hypothetical protein
MARPMGVRRRWRATVVARGRRKQMNSFYGCGEVSEMSKSSAKFARASWHRPGFTSQIIRRIAKGENDELPAMAQ